MLRAILHRDSEEQLQSIPARLLLTPFEGGWEGGLLRSQGATGSKHPYEQYNCAPRKKATCIAVAVFPLYALARESRGGLDT